MECPLKVVLKVDTIISHQRFVTGNFITKRYQNIFQVSCLLKQIPEFYIHPNTTRRQFDPIILEEDFKLTYG